MSFLGEVKRRKVFQAAAVYAVTAWLLVQIVATVEDSDSARRALETVVEKIRRQEPDAGVIPLSFISANIYSEPLLETSPFKELRAQLRGP